MTIADATIRDPAGASRGDSAETVLPRANARLAS
jgi:hypothetical protein